jgi:HAMP domain-containing protein
MEKIRNLGLKWKSGVVVFVALLIVIVILLVVLRKSLNREFEALYGASSTKGLFVAELLATELRPIVGRDGDSLEVQQKVQEIVNIYKSIYGIYGVRYLLVQDSSGGLVADTFKGTVSQSLVELNPLSEEKRCISFPDKAGNQYFDCALPLKLKDKITDKESTGAVRVGVMEQNPQSLVWQKLKTEHVKGVFNPIFYISLLLAIVLSVLLTLAFWYLVIRRIVFITEATERMSFGDLETVVPIKSQDEIGTLEDALERMRANLKDAIERLKRRK